MPEPVDDLLQLQVDRQAASMMSKEPIALQLRFLQTMREIASEHNTTTFLPFPMDLFTPFMNKSGPPKP